MWIVENLWVFAIRSPNGFLTVTILRNVGFESFDSVAEETAGIPFAAMMAELLALPMTMSAKVRKVMANGQIEGVMNDGDRVF